MFEKKIIRLYIFWSAIAAVFALSYLPVKIANAPKNLPLPQEIRTAEILVKKKSGTETLQFVRNPAQEWTRKQDGKKTPQFAKWLAAWQKSCGKKYLQQEVNIPPASETVVLTLNNAQKWYFGVHNSLDRTHSTRLGNDVYFCHEQFKPRLEQDWQYWLRAD